MAFLENTFNLFFLCGCQAWKFLGFKMKVKIISKLYAIKRKEFKTRIMYHDMVDESLSCDIANAAQVKDFSFPKSRN